MDDQAQKQNQDKTNAQVQQPVNPVGSINKEAEMAPVQDFVSPSETSPVMDKEVKDAGIKEVGGAPKLTEEHFKAGVRHAAETTPVSTEPSGTVHLPMTQSQAGEKVKGNTDDSATWLASLIMRIFKKMRLSKDGV